MKKSRAMKERAAMNKRAAREKRVATKKKWRDEANRSCLSAESRIVAVNPKRNGEVTNGGGTAVGATDLHRSRDHQLKMPFPSLQTVQERFPVSQRAKLHPAH